MKEIKINNKYIGKKRPVFIIAEAGVNHNGDMKMARKLIDIAVECGADAIKFQTYKTKNLVNPNAPLADYQKKNYSEAKDQYQMLKSYELTYQQHLELSKYSKQNNIIFCSTPHSGKKDLEILEKLMVPLYKIGSGDLTNLPFLYEVARLNKPTIVSTGMATLKEVKEAKKVLDSSKNPDIIFLHCTSVYPAKHKDLNLKAIQTLEEEFDILVGYSDHSEGIIASTLAVLLGAVVLEKHITVDKTLSGPDHKASMEKNEFYEYIQAVRIAQKRDRSLRESLKLIEKKINLKFPDDLNTLLGNGIKKPVREELKVAKLVRKSIYARKDLTIGSIIRAEDLVIRRPEAFLGPKYLYNRKSIIGKSLTNDLKTGEALKMEYLK